MIDHIASLLGDQASYFLDHTCNTVDKSSLHLPGGDAVDRIYSVSDRSNRVLQNLQRIFHMEGFLVQDILLYFLLTKG